MFVRVAKHGSISSGAKALGMAPSLATRKIAQLEAALQARLLDRNTRSVRLTESGRIALGWAEDTLSRQKKALDDISLLHEEAAGLIRLTTTQYFATRYLPPLLADFCSRHPRLRIAVRTTDSLDALCDQEFDVAIHSGVVLDSNLIGRRVQNFSRVLCASSEYIERHGMPETPGALADHACLCHSLNEGGSWMFARDRAIVSEAIRPTIQADNYAVLLDLVRHSMGIARLAHVMVREDLESGRLLQVLPDHECIYASGEKPGLWLLYPRGDVLFRERLLIDFLMERLPRLSLG